MKIVSITIQNYGAFQGSHTFSFDRRGLVLVLGENLDEPRMKSNGSAKSTIFDALDWCLYGMVPRGDHVDSIINEDAGGNTKVMTNLIDDDGAPYSVARWRGVKGAKEIKPNGCALFRGPNDLTALDDAETQNLIDRVLGMDRDVFHALVLHAQTDTWNFASATDVERIAILTKVLQLGQIDEWLERAKDRAKALGGEVAQAETKLAAQQAAATELVNLDHTVKIGEWNIQHTQQVDEAERLLDMATAGHEKIRGSARSRAQLDQEIAALKAHAPVPSVHPPLPVRPATPMVPVQPVRPPGPVAPALTEERGLISQAQVAIATANAEIVMKRREITQHLQNAETFARQQKGVCGECRQVITADHVAAEVAKLQVTAKQVEQQLAPLEASLQQWRDYERQIQERIQVQERHYGAAVDQWHHEIATLDHEQRQALARHSEHVRQVEAVYDAALAQHRAVVQKVDTDYADLCSVYSGQLAKLQQEAREVENVERLLAQSADAVERARARWESVKREENPWIAEQVKLEARREAVRRATREAGEAAQAAKLSLRYVEFWVQGFGPKGLKSFILDARAQELTDATNHWMRLIYGGTSWVRFETQTMGRSTGKLANKFNVRCFRYMPDGTTRERNFKSMSGGEKQRTSLAIDMGLSRIIASRATKRYDLLVLDEVFKHLDSAGREAVVDMLHQLQAEKSSIFVVDHDQQFAGAFEHRVTVRKQDGRSTILETIGSDNDQNIGSSVSAEVSKPIQKNVPRRRPVSRTPVVRR
jgi:DNA repair exonuclease SbcCD ATPase subunit